MCLSATVTQTVTGALGPEAPGLLRSAPEFRRAFSSTVVRHCVACCVCFVRYHINTILRCRSVVRFCARACNISTKCRVTNGQFSEYGYVESVVHLVLGRGFRCG